MRRRRVGTADRNGDPLDGLVNLWDIALVLAVAFLLAALTGVGLSGVITGEDLTIVTNPGEPDMQVITKSGNQYRDIRPPERRDGERRGNPDRRVLPAGRRLGHLRSDRRAAPAGATPAPYPTPVATPTTRRLHRLRTAPRTGPSPRRRRRVSDADPGARTRTPADVQPTPTWSLAGPRGSGDRLTFSSGQSFRRPPAAAPARGRSTAVDSHARRDRILPLRNSLASASRSRDMSESRLLTSPDQLRALSDPARVDILRRLMASRPPYTARRALDKHPAWIRHHVLQLQKAGLIELVETRKVGGYTEKYYRATAESFAVATMVLPDPGERGLVVVVGSDDPAVHLLAERVRVMPDAPLLLTLAMGSLEGLIALRQGVGDAAGCHLLDPDTGEYNLPYARRLFPGRKLAARDARRTRTGPARRRRQPRPSALSRRCRRARPALRQPQRRLGHRASGSIGTSTASGVASRVAERLRQRRLDPRRRRSAIAGGGADAGLGVRAAARARGLDFVPLFEERYDLVIPWERHETEPVQKRPRPASRDRVPAGRPPISAATPPTTPATKSSSLPEGCLACPLCVKPPALVDPHGPPRGTIPALQPGHLPVRPRGPCRGLGGERRSCGARRRGVHRRRRR